MIAIVDVIGHNWASLTNAIRRLGYACVLTHDARELATASHVILPGVGTAKSAMQALSEHGLVDVLKNLTQPVLGICLGMQLLFEHSEEDNVPCLNLIPGRIKHLPTKADHPIPHMGWNRLEWVKHSFLMNGLGENDYVYFVHSYALLDPKSALAMCQYSERFSALVQHNHLIGMQFHPEKSSEVGLRLLNNFLQWRPS